MLTDSQYRLLTRILEQDRPYQGPISSDISMADLGQLASMCLVRVFEHAEGGHGATVTPPALLVLEQHRRIRELEMRLSLKDAQTALRKAESDHHCAGDRRDWDEVTRTEVELRLAEVAHSKAVTALQKEGHEP